MSKTLYKNWKTEIAWLRRLSKHCLDHAMRFGGSYITGSDATEAFEEVSIALSNRADNLEKAKNAVPQ